MARELTINIDDKALQVSLKKWGSSEPLDKMTGAVAIMARGEVEDEAREISVTSKLVKSFYIDSKSPLKKDIRSYTNYSREALEEGTPPGSNVGGEDLRRWAALKGMGVGKIFTIARKIRLKGSRKWRNKGPKQLTRATKTIHSRLPGFLSKIRKYYA